MSAAVKDVRVIRNSLYIEPISSCNLHCRMCYANVVNGDGRMLRPAGQVLDFVRRLMATADSQVDVYWCGTGEVFLHRDFPQMVNQNRYELDEDPEAVQNYLSLNTYGVYSCCHGVLKMGEPADDINLLMERIVASDDRCRACAMFPCM